jgi:hypothetical protein
MFWIMRAAAQRHAESRDACGGEVFATILVLVAVVVALARIRFVVMTAAKGLARSP